MFSSSVSKIEYIKGGPRDIGAVFRVIKKFKAIFKIKFFFSKVNYIKMFKILKILLILNF